MLPIAFIRQEKERVINSLKKRNFSNIALVDDLIALDDQRKDLQIQLDQLLTSSNALAKEIGALMKAGNKEAAEESKQKATALREEAKELEVKLKEKQEELTSLSLQMPNALQERVPMGKDANDNEIYQEWTAAMPTLHEGALPHWELAKKYQLFDFELGAKVTGAGFPFYMGQGAKLQRAKCWTG